MHFAGENNAASCTRCPAGKFQDASGQSYCKVKQPCAPGTFEANAADTSPARCRKCPVMHFSDASNAEACERCPSGKFQSTDGQPYCEVKQPCAPGTFVADATDQSTARCHECPAMHYSSTTDAASCTPCEAGKYQTQAGQPFCNVCPRNARFSANASACVCNEKHFYCPPHARDGQDCGDAAVEDAERAKHRDACIPCDAFAKGADCGTLGATLMTLTTREGFWRATNATAVFHPCNPLNKAECKGAATPANGTRDTQCAVGHTGPKCSACDRAKGFVRKYNGACNTCAPGEGEALMLVAPLALAVFAVVGYCVTRIVSVEALHAGMVKRTIKIRILFGFVQVLTRMTLAYNLQMPPAVAQFYNAMSFLEAVDLTSWVSGASCLYESNFITKVYAQTGLALAVMLGFMLWFGVGAAVLALDEDGDGHVSWSEFVHWLRGGCKGGNKQPTKSMATCVNLALLFTFLIYPSITSTLFFAFGCTKYEDGESYLTIDMSINCRDTNYLEMRLWALCMIPVFVLGIPAAYMCMLWKHRAALNPKPSAPAQRRDAALVGRDAWAHKQREHDPSIQHLSFLWSGYRPKLWWFEVFEMARKFLMTGAPILITLAFGETEYLSVAYGMLVTTLTTAVHALGDPYLNKVDALLLLPGQFAVFLSLVAGMIKKLSTGDSAEAGITGLILGTGVPIALLMLCNCVWPDSADKLLARGRHRVVTDLLGKMRERIPPKLAKAAETIDWEQLGHELTTMVTGDTLTDALDDPEAFLVRLLRAQLHARVAGSKAQGVHSPVPRAPPESPRGRRELRERGRRALLERVDRQLADGGVETLGDVLVVLQDLVSLDTIATGAGVAAAHLLAPKLNARLEGLGIDSESRQAVADKFSAIGSDELEQVKQAAEELLSDGPSWNVLQQLLGALGLDEEFQARALLGAVKQLLAERLALPASCRAQALRALSELEQEVSSAGGVASVKARIEQVVDAALPLLGGDVSEDRVLAVLSALCGDEATRESLQQQVVEKAVDSACEVTISIANVGSLDVGTPHGAGELPRLGAAAAAALPSVDKLLARGRHRVVKVAPLIPQAPCGVAAEGCTQLRNPTGGTTPCEHPETRSDLRTTMPSRSGAANPPLTPSSRGSSVTAIEAAAAAVRYV
jgi:hypothetical protein